MLSSTRFYDHYRETFSNVSMPGEDLSLRSRLRSRRFLRLLRQNGRPGVQNGLRRQRGPSSKELARAQSGDLSSPKRGWEDGINGDWAIDQKPKPPRPEIGLRGLVANSWPVQRGIWSSQKSIDTKPSWPNIWSQDDYIFVSTLLQRIRTIRYKVSFLNVSLFFQPTVPPCCIKNKIQKTWSQRLHERNNNMNKNTWVPTDTKKHLQKPQTQTHDLSLYHRLLFTWYLRPESTLVTLVFVPAGAAGRNKRAAWGMQWLSAKGLYTGHFFDNAPFKTTNIQALHLSRRNFHCGKEFPYQKGVFWSKGNTKAGPTLSMNTLSLASAWQTSLPFERQQEALDHRQDKICHLLSTYNCGILMWLLSTPHTSRQDWWLKFRESVGKKLARSHRYLNKILFQTPQSFKEVDATGSGSNPQSPAPNIPNERILRLLQSW